MISEPTFPPFQSRVELDFAPGSKEPGKLKPGADVLLVARFRDFLGEPTSATGPVRLTADKGSLFLPNSQLAGSEITFQQGEVPIGETGELPIVYKPSGEHGKVSIRLACDLGTDEIEFTIPAPSGFALAEMLESVIYAFLVAIVIRIFFFQTFWIPSGSMEPTLYEGDRIIANKLVYRMREPHRGEVVIFRVFQPGSRGRGALTLDEALASAETRRSCGFNRGEESAEAPAIRVEVQDYIKRVVGLPGDVIEVNNGEIYVNGEVLIESFDTRPPDYDRYGPITVPPGEVFVLGDNRSNSQDSHVIGTVPIRNIEGRAEVVFWPPRRIRLIPRGD